ncbi:hypothetical protein, variant [Cladophialophora immunda]|uniref:O-methyltransferase domain-containing protein n=1 Tax=Cladophialophora immunda TaxID=569365 RepID=A0A0D1ZH63_9EURO|nr:uncharacterized protein PV07_07043 [Cladophialophora immunda]XP_016247508.1 hypothetical protein, variant [Cladophialophora immunda]KIW27291.1 hypothetical protein PV07_07043 [Cladophialophora immunda]KIW27292.1 hypothetical protein, variant [Cladophialophora immunda]
MAPQTSQELVSLVRDLSGAIAGVDSKRGLSVTQREHILRLNRAIQNKVQPPEDHIIATAFTINLNICIRACIELGVFELLDSAAPNWLSAPDIARALNAEELLITRFMRGVCALNFATEVGPGRFLANDVTHALVQPPLAAGFSLMFDNAARPKSNLWSHMERFRQHGYKSPFDAKDGPYQHANDCVGMTTFEHWMTDPAESARFNTFMKGVRGSRPNWYTWFDVQMLLGGGGASGCDAEDEVFMVDVAGGYGHDLDAFLQRHGDQVQGRVILQDLPGVVDAIEPGSISNRIEIQRHDFFTAQPVRGARVYFMHMIMHDWPDDDCVRILTHLRDAMRRDHSQILINDMILPDTQCPLIATGMDITMMAHHCGVERNEDMWRSLIAKVDGLELIKIWHPPEGEGILQVSRK